MNRHEKIISWVAQGLAAIIMFCILYQQLTGSNEAIYVFRKIGLEPFGRISSALAELLAVICLITGIYVWQGAVIGLVTMSCAFVFHLTKLGINVLGDNGQLFSLSIITLICCLLIIFIRRDEINKQIS